MQCFHDGTLIYSTYFVFMPVHAFTCILFWAQWFLMSWEPQRRAAIKQACMLTLTACNDNFSKAPVTEHTLASCAQHILRIGILQEAFYELSPAAYGRLPTGRATPLKQG
jgi:hypothetical protein